uniref:cytochrome P450 4C1-like n=1 Tax=Maniola jurtina TaxID=191418 RepID=UPI003B63B55B
MFLLLLQCFIILLIYLYWVTRNKEFDKIPGPPGIFFFHNALDFLMDPVELFYYVRNLAKTYKKIFRLRLGPVKCVIIQTPEDIEKVINGTTCTEKGIIYNFIEPWLKGGLLLSKGPKWQQRRKLLTPAFHFNVLANFKSVIEENCQNFVYNLEKEVNATKTDITPYVNDFAINSICETAMGTKLDEEDINFSKIYKEGIYKLGQYAVYRAQRVWMYPDMIFKFTAVARKVENILKILTSFRDRVIQNRKKLYNNKNNFIDEQNGNENDNVDISGKRRMALLDLLLQAEKKGVIDAKGIGEETDTFMFGGHDTSANALQFIMMLLANNQDAQEKVVKECNKIFGSSTQRVTTMADLAQMKYLECCLKECLRLYPPLPILNRKVKETISLGTYQIPAGIECGILIFEMHRRSDQFVEPLAFRPERFQTEPTWHPYAYIPFSAGPRNCIGQKYAMMELKLAVSALLRRYRLLPVTKPDDIVFVMDYVLRVKEPIYVKLEERCGFKSEV